MESQTRKDSLGAHQPPSDTAPCSGMVQLSCSVEAYTLINTSGLVVGLGMIPTWTWSGHSQSLANAVSNVYFFCKLISHQTTNREICGGVEE